MCPKHTQRRDFGKCFPVRYVWFYCISSKWSKVNHPLSCRLNTSVLKEPPWKLQMQYSIRVRWHFCWLSILTISICLFHPSVSNVSFSCLQDFIKAKYGCVHLWCTWNAHLQPLKQQHHRPGWRAGDHNYCSSSHLVAFQWVCVSYFVE